MTEAPIVEGPLQAGSPLRTPRAAALAGLGFSVLLISALVLLRIFCTGPCRCAGRMADRFVAQNGGRDSLEPRSLRRNRVPVVRRGSQGPDRRAEDRFFATVFLGSGLLFVAMLFAAAAISGGLIADASSASPSAGTLALGRNVTAILLNIYHAMRMAAVFTLTTVTIARRTEIVSRWLTVAGLVSALVLLVGVGISPWVELLFPLWILALSIDILAAGLRIPAHAAGPARQG